MDSSQATGDLRESPKTFTDTDINTEIMPAQQPAAVSERTSKDPKHHAEQSPQQHNEPSRGQQRWNEQVDNAEQQPPETRLKQIHPPVMAEALKALLDNSIIVMEYGTQFQFRYGYEDAPHVVEWVVPDEQLSHAPEALIECGFPRTYSYNKQLEYGFWDSQSIPHDLDRKGLIRVNLLTMSLVGITLDETIDVPATFTDELWVLSPKPQRYIVSLIRHLLDIPIGDPSRRRVEMDIGCFYCAYFIQRGCAQKDHVGKEMTDEEYFARVEDGVRMLRAWDWGPGESRYLELAEKILRNAWCILEMTDQPKASPEPHA